MKRSIAQIGATGIFLAVLFGILYLAPENPHQYLSRLKGGGGPLTAELRRDIAGVAEQRGIPFAVEVIAEAVGGSITNDDCHSLLHLIGHEAYAWYGNNFKEALAANNGRLCLGGYVHGIEAEIAASSPSPTQELGDFCALTKKFGVNNGPCFHGVGHSAFELTKDVRQSLGQCDKLKDAEPELWNCYRGVFSELGNALLGIDTNTGLPGSSYEGGDVTREDPYALCDSLAIAYRDPCYSQLAKVFFEPRDVRGSVNRCLAQRTSRAQGICINTVVGIGVRGMLETKGLPEVAALLDTIPAAYLSEALAGAREGIGAHIEDGKVYDFKELCRLLATGEARCLAQS